MNTILGSGGSDVANERLQAKRGLPVATDTVEFDLSGLVRDWRALHRTSRVFKMITVSVAGIFLVGIALYTGIASTKLPRPQIYEVSAILALTGCAVSLSPWFSPTNRRIPTHLVVSASGFSLGDGSGAQVRVRSWDDKKLRLQLRDLRGMHGGPAQAGKRPGLWLIPTSSLWVPIPEQAFDAVLVRAREHRLDVVTSAGIAGEVIVRISSH